MSSPSPLPASAPQPQFKLVVDKSFLHDVFRDDYEGRDHAEWLWNYAHRRLRFTAVKFLVVSKSIVERIQRELPSHGVNARVVAASYNVLEVSPVTADDLSFAPLYVALDEATKGVIPLILSTVNSDKWNERIRKAGMELHLEAFSPEMSDRRTLENSWCWPVTTKEIGGVLSALDPHYQEVVRRVGLPPR